MAAPMHTLPALADARRNLAVMVNRVEAGGLSPEAFVVLVTEIYGSLNEIEIMLEGAGLLDMPLFAGLPVARARFVGHLAVIDGGRP